MIRNLEGGDRHRFSHSMMSEPEFCDFFFCFSLMAVKWWLLLQPSYTHSWKDEVEKRPTVFDAFHQKQNKNR